MAIKINLLPPELSVSRGLGKTLKTTRTLGLIFVAAFIIFILGLLGFFLINTFSLRSISSDVEDLKAQITAQQTSEQQMVLLKDRVGKIAIALKIPGATENINDVDPILSSFSPESFVNQLEADSEKIDLTVNIRNNADLSNFLANLKAQTVFKSAVLSSFSFNSVNGYLIGATLIR